MPPKISEECAYKELIELQFDYVGGYLHNHLKK
jgi:hypothetical protein